MSMTYSKMEEQGWGSRYSKFQQLAISFILKLTEITQIRWIETYDVILKQAVYYIIILVNPRTEHYRDFCEHSRSTTKDISIWHHELGIRRKSIKGNMRESTDCWEAPKPDGCELNNEG